MLAITASGCTTADGVRAAADDRMRSVFASNWDRIAALSSSTCTITPHLSPTCEIFVTKVTFTGSDGIKRIVCVAVAPHVSIELPASSTDQIKEVIWELKDEKPGGGGLSFPEKNGFIFTTEGKGHIVSHESGKPTNGLITSYSVKVKKPKVNPNPGNSKLTSYYLPVVLWGDAPAGPDAEDMRILCAAVDPKIVNEN